MDKQKEATSRVSLKKGLKDISWMIWLGKFVGFYFCNIKQKMKNVERVEELTKDIKVDMQTQVELQAVLEYVEQ